jgi:hypothetical protein
VADHDLSQDFLKAVFLAFVVIAAVTIAPLDGTSSNTPVPGERATVAGAREGFRGGGRDPFLRPPTL